MFAGELILQLLRELCDSNWHLGPRADSQGLHCCRYVVAHVSNRGLQPPPGSLTAGQIKNQHFSYDIYVLYQ